MRLHRRRRFLRAVCATLVVSLCIEGSGFDSMAAMSAAEEQRAAQFATQLRASIQALEDGDREAPRDRWDPAYVVDNAGIEPAALLQWMRGSVVWMPYRGALRGATGVLMDRVGNSVDQALLMAELLRAAGKTVRLAHADLPPSVANEAWQRVVGASKQPFQPAPSLSAEDAASAATPPEDVLESADLYGIDRSRVTAILGTARKDAIDMSRDLRARVEDQLARLTTALALPADSGSAASPAEGLVAIADHWWVQYRDGKGWIDVDPLAAEPGVGAALAPASANYEVEAIPADLEHRVTLRMVTEQTKDGALEEGAPVEQQLRTRDLIGKRIVLSHFPMAWPKDWPQVTPDDVQIKLRAAFLSQDQWLPMLRIGDATISRAAVRDTGEVNENPTPASPFRTMMVPAMGQLAKATDTLATIGEPDEAMPATEKAPDEAARAEGELTAEWLEIEFASPGAKPRKVRREIFDLIGPAQRGAGARPPLVMTEDRKIARSMALLGEIELSVLPCRLSHDYAMHLAALNASANRELLDEISSDPFSKLPPNYMDTFGKLTPLPAGLLGFALVRFEGNPFAGGLYVDRATVVAQHTTMSRGKGGDFFANLSLDIIENGVGIDPRVAVNASQARMAQGIADTNAEMLSLRKLGQTAVPNTAEAFAADGKSGRKWTALEPGDEAKVAKLGLDANLAARLALDLKAGYAVVVPQGSGPGGDSAATGPGWWRVDPATGGTLGMGAQGHGQAMVEYAIVIAIQVIIGTAQCMLANAASAALTRALKERGKAQGPTDAIKEGYKVGKESWEKADGYKCVANGMLSGIEFMVQSMSMSMLMNAGKGAPDLIRKGEKLNTSGGPGRPAGSGPRGTMGFEGAPPLPPPLPPERTMPLGKGEPPPPSTPKGQPPGGGSKPPPSGPHGSGPEHGAPQGRPDKPSELAKSVDPSGSQPKAPPQQPPKPPPTMDDWKKAWEKVEQAEKNLMKANQSGDPKKIGDARDQYEKAQQEETRTRYGYQESIGESVLPRKPGQPGYTPKPPRGQAHPDGSAMPTGGETPWGGYESGQGPSAPAPAAGASAAAMAPGGTSPWGAPGSPTPPSGGAPFGGYPTGSGPVPPPSGPPSGTAPPFGGYTTGSGPVPPPPAGGSAPTGGAPPPAKFIPADQSPVGFNPFADTQPGRPAPSIPPPPPPSTLAGAAGLSGSMQMLMMPAP